MTAAPGTGALEEGGHLLSIDTKMSVPSTALTPWGSNPAQTTTAGGDTAYSFGANGNTPANHAKMQNNSTINVLVAFDQSAASAATGQVYVLAPGQLWEVDRAFTVLHFSSASQLTFGGSTGITVEGFA